MKKYLAGLLATLIIVVFIGAGLVLVNVGQSFSCHSKWGDSGMDVDYDIIGGCKIKTKTGWIPAENYREM